MSDGQTREVWVPLGRHAEVSFRSWRQVAKWLEETETAWRWLSGAHGPDPANLAHYVPARLASAKQEVTNAMEGKALLQEAASIFARHLNDNYAPPHPGTDAARQIFEIRDLAGEEAAKFAFALSQELVSFANIGTNQQWRGVSLVLNPEVLFAAGEAERFKRERTSYRNAAAKIFDDVRARESLRSEEWKGAVETAAGTAATWSKTLTRRWLRTSLKARARERSAMAKLHATDVTFTEKMALKAPVEYWEKKAAKHKASEGVMQGWLWVYFPLAFTCLVGMFGGVGYYLLTTPATSLPPGLTVVASAGLATSAGMLFWIGRLLTKLYLSQHHLRQDAEERATMTTTYLALTEVSAPGDTDRQIVLNALFRSTPDGIVKEEGGLDPNLASALGRFLAR